jgi:hypothetical protein
MEASAGFGTSQLFLTDSRLVLAVLNHLRYQALNRAFGLSREQANVVTAVVLLGAADGAYEATRRIAGMRPHVSGTDAALGAIAMREASLGMAGPSVRAIPGLGRSWRSRSSAASPRPLCGGPASACAPPSSGCALPRRGCAASASGATRPREIARGQARRSPSSRRNGTRLARGCTLNSKEACRHPRSRAAAPAALGGPSPAEE